MCQHIIHLVYLLRVLKAVRHHLSSPRIPSPQSSSPLLSLSRSLSTFALCQAPLRCPQERSRRPLAQHTQQRHPCLPRGRARITLSLATSEAPDGPCLGTPTPDDALLLSWSALAAPLRRSTPFRARHGRRPSRPSTSRARPIRRRSCRPLLPGMPCTGRACRRGSSSSRRMQTWGRGLCACARSRTALASPLSVRESRTSCNRTSARMQTPVLRRVPCTGGRRGTITWQDGSCSKMTASADSRCSATQLQAAPDGDAPGHRCCTQSRAADLPHRRGY